MVIQRLRLRRWSPVILVTAHSKLRHRVNVPGASPPPAKSTQWADVTVLEPLVTFMELPSKVSCRLPAQPCVRNNCQSLYIYA